jgi:hypothetical protein
MQQAAGIISLPSPSVLATKAETFQGQKAKTDQAPFLVLEFVSSTVHRTSACLAKPQLGPQAFMFCTM